MAQQNTSLGFTFIKPIGRNEETQRAPPNMTTRRGPSFGARAFTRSPSPLASGSRGIKQQIEDLEAVLLAADTSIVGLEREIKALESTLQSLQTAVAGLAMGFVNARRTLDAATNAIRRCHLEGHASYRHPLDGHLYWTPMYLELVTAKERAEAALEKLESRQTGLNAKITTANADRTERLQKLAHYRRRREEDRVKYQALESLREEGRREEETAQQPYRPAQQQQMPHGQTSKQAHPRESRQKRASDPPPRQSSKSPQPQRGSTAPSGWKPRQSSSRPDGKVFKPPRAPMPDNWSVTTASEDSEASSGTARQPSRSPSPPRARSRQSGRHPPSPEDLAADFANMSMPQEQARDRQRRLSPGPVKRGSLWLEDMNEQVRVAGNTTARTVRDWESSSPAWLAKNLFERYYDYFYISGSRRPAGSSGRSTASARSPERTRIREMLKDCLNAVDALPSVRNRLRLCVVAELQVVRRQVYLRAKDVKLGADLNAIRCL